MEDSLSNCQKHVERLLFCHLKRKQLRCSGSEKKQRVEPELAPSRLEKNSQHRQLRERERESDRLGRLLRRAAELDVTRCCNDVRTLLVARGQCEEANLQVCSPPSVQGEYGAGPYARGMSSTSNSAISFNQVTKISDTEAERREERSDKNTNKEKATLNNKNENVIDLKNFKK